MGYPWRLRLLHTRWWGTPGGWGNSIQLYGGLGGEEHKEAADHTDSLYALKYVLNDEKLILIRRHRHIRSTHGVMSRTQYGVSMVINCIYGRPRSKEPTRLLLLAIYRPYAINNKLAAACSDTCKQSIALHTQYVCVASISLYICYRHLTCMTYIIIRQCTFYWCCNICRWVWQSMSNLIVFVLNFNFIQYTCSTYFKNSPVR